MLRVVFLSLGLAAATAVPATVCDSTKWHDGYGSLASKYKTVHCNGGACNATQCCQQCASDPSCGHFVLKNGDCNFKAGAPNLTARKGCVTGVPQRAPTPPPTTPPTPPPTPVAPPPLGFKPHIIFFLADDFGHYNMGWRGNKEARTPNMDALVREGVVLDRHYVYQFCSPTRSAFLSGRLPIHMNTKNMAPTAFGGVDPRATTIADHLKSAGYATHQTGKWNAGSLLYSQTPTMRGFDTAFGYMSGEEDHYTQQGGYGKAASNYMPAELLSGVGYTAGESATLGGDDNAALVDLLENGSPALGKNGTYGAFMYAAHTIDIIKQHDPATPLFVYHAWQEAHTPNEVPGEFLAANGTIDWPLRRTYEGMVHAMDSGIGNITQALKDKGMWDRTLVVFSSDNGGREDNEFGGNNFPLRGMKFSDWEGGTRVAAWASGGVVPAARRGATETGLMHVADWLATFSALAGVDPTDRKAVGTPVPPIDSLNMWSTIGEGKPSPRTTLTLSKNAHIHWPHKIITGNKGKGVWTGPKHPNSTKLADNDPGCPDTGCVFDIEQDPTEHNDLAATQPDLRAQLLAELATANQGAYQTGADQYKGDYTNCTTIKEWVKKYPGFGGPLCYKGPIPI